MEIDIKNLPNKQKLIFTLSNTESLYENYNLNKYLIKIIKHKQSYNIYRYDKVLNTKIKPFDFMYYYKNTNNRSKISHTPIRIINKINENVWDEHLTINDKNYIIKVVSNDFQIIMYLIDDENILFELFNLKIRQNDNKYIVRLEMGFNIFNMEQELQFKEQIELINDFEKVILYQMC